MSQIGVSSCPTCSKLMAGSSCIYCNPEKFSERDVGRQKRRDLFKHYNANWKEIFLKNPYFDQIAEFYDCMQYMNSDTIDSGWVYSKSNIMPVHVEYDPMWGKRAIEQMQVRDKAVKFQRKEELSCPPHDEGTRITLTEPVVLKDEDETSSIVEDTSGEKLPVNRIDVSREEIKKMFPDSHDLIDKAYITFD